jgi:hypothetical protein
MTLHNYSRLQKIRLPLGCTLIAHLLLVIFGLFCLFVPRALLTYENLPVRYKDLAFLGQIFYYTGIVLVAIAILDLLRILIRLFKTNRSSR